jgi:hypothetical protein
MSIKDDLHTLVDQLDDDEAVVALSYLREVLDAESTTSEPRSKSLGERKGPPSVSGKEFFAEKPRPDVMDLAREQGVLPLSSFDDLLGDFWPEDESVDDFIDEIRALRRRDGYA